MQFTNGLLSFNVNVFRSYFYCQTCFTLHVLLAVDRISDINKPETPFKTVWVPLN